MLGHLEEALFLFKAVKELLTSGIMAGQGDRTRPETKEVISNDGIWGFGTIFGWRRCQVCVGVCEPRNWAAGCFTSL